MEGLKGSFEGFSLQELRELQRQLGWLICRMHVWTNEYTDGNAVCPKRIAVIAVTVAKKETAVEIAP